jgi:amidase
MARTVTDAALLLAALAGPDPRDPGTISAAAHVPADYSAELQVDGLKGARIGVARNFFGFNPAVDAIMERCIKALRQAGAEIVDPVEVAHVKDIEEPEMEVLLHEFHADLDAYLGSHDGQVHSLADVIAFNEAHADQVMPHFGQELMQKALAKGPLTDERYLAALAACRRLSRDEGIDGTLASHRLDAIVEPSGGPAWLTDHIAGDHYTGSSSSPAAVAGYPSITVPAGFVHGLPVGITFVGTAWTESRLIRYAYAFEQTTKLRQRPQFPRSAV